MASPVQLSVLLLITLASAPPIHGQILTNDNTPSLIDRVLQVLWEPSSLIRVWVGLDQLYNVALSWKSVAKKLASLPFGEERSMDHVKIQEPRNFKYQKLSVASQWDRFNKIYASSNLSPLVAHARSRQTYGPLLSNPQALESYVPIFQAEPNSALSGLPPPVLFQPQEIFINPDSIHFLESANENVHSSSFVNNEDPLLVSKLLELQKFENLKILQNRRYFKPVGSASSLVPKQLNDLIGAPNGNNQENPQERLIMLLKLLKMLGDIHTNVVARDSLETSDS